MFATTPASAHAVEAVMVLPLFLFGLSHILHPDIWQSFFEQLARKGTQGIFHRVFLIELWPASLILAFHQTWTWPGIIVTLFGCVLLIKVGAALLLPDHALRTLERAVAGEPRGFFASGIVLIGMAIFCGSRALL